MGANCGAAAVHFARHYPDAVVHSFEPATEPRQLLERNAASYPNITVHPFGLFSKDDEVPLFLGDGDSILGSIHRRSVNLEESEPVVLRDARAWMAEAGLDRIDVLKVDVEGCELDVLERLRDYLPTVKVLYVEYESRQTRRALFALLEPTHELYRGDLYLNQGECIFLRNDFVELRAANDRLLEMLGATMRGGQPDG